MSREPKCEATYWVRGKGVRECKNRAKRRGYMSDVTWSLVCQRHANLTYRYTGPLTEADLQATQTPALGEGGT